ncbi:DUF3168 domain-containing protein [uncultured Bacteroides sp.]|uniref:DUF3168 domain-containing protein n=1 Tax=uncultured Bacteroides sp. TaxID=162156 RepID=UPI002AA8D4EE|nr:DUF3168 domain-containing protein [uncultured Bacteroides sp.]
MSKFSITTDIRKILINNEELKSLIGNKIYPLFAPDNTQGDFIIYYRDEYSKEYATRGIITNESCKIWIAIVSDNYDKSIQIAEKVNDLVDGIHTDSNNNQYQCRLKDSTEDSADKKYIQILVFEIS